MPFLSLPADEALLRFSDGQITLHYLVSTPSHPTFAYAHTHAAALAASLLPASPLTPTTASPPPGAGVQLDPLFPLILFLPSECFSVAHLFSAQLADPVLSARFNLVAVDPRGHGLTRDVPIKQGAGRKYDLDVKAADCLDFLQLLIGGQKWAAGMHIVACSMSGLVAARMAARWPDAFASIMVTSPIVERESDFMVESFQGIKELLEESWHALHDEPSGTRACMERRMSDDSLSARLPGEVVQGFSFRWAGSESIPHHISSYLSRTWLERLVLHRQGLEAARDWWFDLYWLRQPMSHADLARIKCDILVVEGDSDLPYDRNVGDEVAELFPNARLRTVVTADNAPFLLSVMRPEELTREVCRFLRVDGEAKEMQGGVEGVGERIVCGLEEAERFELVKVYGAGLLVDSDSDDDDDGGSQGSPMQYRFKLHTLPTATDDGSDAAAPTLTRGKRAGSASSASNNYFSTSMYHTAEAAEAPLVRTMHETHL